MNTCGTINLRSVFFLIVSMLMLSACEHAKTTVTNQGDMALLALESNGFAQASRNNRMVFPADHGSHPEYWMEWWYVTANLEDKEGRQYGVQWTLFRLAGQSEEYAPDRLIDTQANSWSSKQVFMAHMALSWPGGHDSAQRYARGGNSSSIDAQARVVRQPFEARLDDWVIKSKVSREENQSDSGWLPLEMHARQGGMAYRLELSGPPTPVMQGDNGFSQKHASGGGSHYYSQPNLKARGELTVAGKTVQVTGDAWFDHEWSSQFLQPDQSGWDWFALHLDSGEKLMVYRLRSKKGEPYQSGVLLGPDGERQDIPGDDILLTETRWAQVAGRRIPVEWRIDITPLVREWTLSALHDEQWMEVDFAYWEGVVLVGSDSDDPGNRGRGYLEMTGYTPR